MNADRQWPTLVVVERNSRLFWASAAGIATSPKSVRECVDGAACGPRSTLVSDLTST